MDEKLKHIARKIAMAVIKSYVNPYHPTHMVFPEKSINAATIQAYEVLLAAMKQTNKEKNESQEEALRRVWEEEKDINFYGH
jgi:hypothetical protein